MISMETTCTFGITLVALIVLLHAICYVTVTTYICNSSFYKGKCPDDNNFYSIRYASLFYVVLIPILAIYGFVMKTSIPLIVSVIIWIFGVILLQMKDPKIRYVVGEDKTNLVIPISNSPFDPIKVFREFYHSSFINKTQYNSLN